MEKSYALETTWPFTYLYIGVSLAAFLIPFIVSGPQILVGSVVNAILFASSLKFSGKQLFPLVFLPSLAVILRGMLFGPLTPVLILLLPSIWLGNMVLVLTSKTLNGSAIKPLGILLPSLTKSLVILGFALTLYHWSLVPKMFVTSMGTTQFATAALGGTAVYLYQHRRMKVI